uniref:Ig-like domain-containing protein n=1 Tax=Callorhinchus milii TaxID=7868 RepID=A0A4W3HEV3_CALMI
HRWPVDQWLEPSHNQATAVCLAFGFHPDILRVKWLRDWLPITSGVVSSPSVKGDNVTFSTSSRLTVPAREWRSGAVYTCQVSHEPTHTIIVKNITSGGKLGNSWYTWQERHSQFPFKCPLVRETGPQFSRCIQLVATKAMFLIFCVKIYFLPPAQRQVLMDSSVTLTCVVVNAPLHVNVTWTQGNTHLQSGYGKTSATEPQKVISKLNISVLDWNSGKEYFCVASHDDIPSPIREKTFKKTVEHVKQPSVYLLLPSAEELSAQQSVTLTCLVKDFAPKEIFVQWTENDQVIDGSNFMNTDVMADSADHIYSMYSMLSISAGDWGRGNSYSCLVGHETFPMKTLTRSVNKSSGKPSFVNISLVLMDTVNACQ